MLGIDKMHYTENELHVFMNNPVILNILLTKYSNPPIKGLKSCLNIKTFIIQRNNIIKIQ